MKKYLQEDNPLLYEKIKGHEVDMPDDWQGEFPIFCKKCGKKGVMRNNLSWVCPELFNIPDEYMGVM